MNKNEILIIRALNNSSRHMRNENKTAAKNSFDKAFAIMVENNDISWEVQKKVYWLKDNFYQKKSFNCAGDGPDYENLILAKSGL